MKPKVAIFDLFYQSIRGYLDNKMMKH